MEFYNNDNSRFMGFQRIISKDVEVQGSYGCQLLDEIYFKLIMQEQCVCHKTYQKHIMIMSYLVKKEGNFLLYPVTLHFCSLNLLGVALLEYYNFSGFNRIYAIFNYFWTFQSPKLIYDHHEI